jgi:hypothetical protein
MRGPPPDYDRRSWGGRGPRGRMGPPPMMDGRGPYGGPPPGGFRGGFGGPPPGMGMGEQSQSARDEVAHMLRCHT